MTSTTLAKYFVLLLTFYSDVYAMDGQETPDNRSSRRGSVELEIFSECVDQAPLCERISELRASGNPSTTLALPLVQLDDPVDWNEEPHFGAPAITLTFTARDSASINQAAKANRSRAIAFVVGRKVVAMSLVVGPIGRTVSITQLDRQDPPLTLLNYLSKFSVPPSD